VVRSPETRLLATPEGKANLVLRLDVEPVDLLRDLEQRHRFRTRRKHEVYVGYVGRGAAASGVVHDLEGRALLVNGRVGRDLLELARCVHVEGTEVELLPGGVLTCVVQHVLGGDEL
jgi:hypothetical protein